MAQSNTDTQGRMCKSPVCPLIITHVLPLVGKSLEHVMKMRPFDYEVLSPTLITSHFHFIIITAPPSTHILE